MDRGYKFKTRISWCTGREGE